MTGSAPPDRAQDNLERLHAKIDAFFDRVQGTYRDHMACAPGCASCCYAALSLFPVEIARLLAAVDTLPSDARARLRERVERASSDGACALLDEAQCVVYSARPTICRSHGLPLRVRGTDGSTRRDVCPLSFTGPLPLAQVAESDLLDLERTDRMIALVDHLAVAAGDVPEGRLDLRLALRRHLAGGGG